MIIHIYVGLHKHSLNIKRDIKLINSEIVLELMASLKKYDWSIKFL